MSGANLDEKYCNKCDKTLPISSFYRKPWKNEQSLSSWSSYCSECAKAYKREFYIKNKERLKKEHSENYQKNREYYREREADKRLKRASPDKRAKILERRAAQALKGDEAYIHGRMSGWRGSAKSRGLCFDLTREFILDLLKKQNGRCFFSGVEIELARNQAHTLSLDRLDSNLGYSKENTVVCSLAVNKMKQDLSLSEFYSLCELILRHKKD